MAFGNTKHNVFDGLAAGPFDPPSQEFIHVRSKRGPLGDFLAFFAGDIVLLCHKFGYLLRAAQHGQRESVVARAATNLRRIVAIEFGTWRSGRNGASSGLVTLA